MKISKYINETGVLKPFKYETVDEILKRMGVEFIEDAWEKALISQDAQVLIVLLKSGKVGRQTLDVEEDGETALTFSCITGENELVELLMKKGAGDMIPNAWGELPMYLAIRLENYEAVEILLKSGVNPNFSDEAVEEGLNPMRYAQLLAVATPKDKRENLIKIMQIIKKYGGKANDDF